MSVHEIDTAVSLDDRLPAPVIFDGPIIFGADGLAVGPLGHSLREHVEVFGGCAAMGGIAGRWLIQQVQEAGVTGRGGAHVGAWLKLASAAASGPGGTVVINGAEGEPASAKDAALLQLRPHLVIDGAVAAAECIDAVEIVVWLHESATHTRVRVANALLERRARGLDEPPIRILLAPDGYVSGESSAVIRGVRGGPALPQFRLDRARPWGDGPAVLVHNAETCARLALLARTGLREHVDSALVTVTETAAPLQVSRRTVMEVADGRSIADVVREATGWWPGAVLLGGYGGSWISADDARRLACDQAALAAEGQSLGAGVLLALPTGRSVLREAAAICGYMADQSAVQCGPCQFGLPAITRQMQEVLDGRDARKLRQIADLVSGRGACRHPDGTIRMALSAIALADRGVPA